MKYELLVLKVFFKKKLFKWLIFYAIFVFVCVYLISKSINTIFFNLESIKNLLVLEKISEFSFIEFLLLIYIVFLTIYITYSIFIYDYNNSIEFTFLRFGIIKRNIYKIITILFTLFLIRTIYYLIFYIFFCKYFVFNLALYINSISFYCLLSIVVYFLLIALKKI